MHTWKANIHMNEKNPFWSAKIQLYWEETRKETYETKSYTKQVLWCTSKPQIMLHVSNWVHLPTVSYRLFIFTQLASNNGWRPRDLIPQAHGQTPSESSAAKPPSHAVSLDCHVSISLCDPELMQHLFVRWMNCLILWLAQSLAQLQKYISLV